MAPTPSPAAGHVHIYTGEGKGKTTCALGLITRASGAGLRSLLLQFDKGHTGEDWCSERAALAHLPGVEVIGTGCPRLLADGGFRFANTEEDFAEAQRALGLAREAIASSQHDLIVLDEAVTCVQTKLLRAEEIEALLDGHREHPRATLVLTGRGAWPALLAKADLVTEMKKHRHPFDRGATPRRGIDL